MKPSLLEVTAHPPSPIAAALWPAGSARRGSVSAATFKADKKYMQDASKTATEDFSLGVCGTGDDDNLPREMIRV